MAEQRRSLNDRLSGGVRGKKKKNIKLRWCKPEKKEKRRGTKLSMKVKDVTALT